VLHPIVLGTAGHIDHGKTALVRALTGIDTDRLPVEKARGITTELGFARMDLATPAGIDRRVAVVDVPGHERFVKSMVAGATGLDLVILVIAADEGVMPQTREHLDICSLLGVRRGLVALTKSDLVEDEWLAMVTADVRAAVADTFLADAPIVPVSTKTGANLSTLRTAIAALIDTLPPRSSTNVFRLPIDRIFTRKGFGTIVTGTILGGEVAVGDELTVIPSNLTTRVRGIEVHGAPVERAIAGHRAALNLGNLAVDDLARGDLLSHPGRVAPSHILDVEYRHLATSPAPLTARTKVLVHHGATQVLATLALVGTTTLAPGATSLAQLRVDATTPLGALPDDRFIVRGFVTTATHGSTIGGGRIIRVLAPKARTRTTVQHADTVAALSAAAARLDHRLALDIRTAAFAGLSLPDLVRRLGMPPTVLAPPLATLVAAGDLLTTGEGDHTHYLHATSVAELEARILAKLTSSPDVAISREELRTQLPAALPRPTYDALVAGLVRKGTLADDGDRVRKPTAPARTSTTLSPHEAKLVAQLQSSNLEPLRLKDLPTALGIAEPQLKAALARLVAAKLAVKVNAELYMHAASIAALREKLLGFLEANKTIDAQQWKELTGASRKFTIPLAEYFDAEKVTLRVGDVRRKR
jgi:selenocysteine-specific elongation factor